MMRSRLLRLTAPLLPCLLAFAVGGIAHGATITIDLPHLTGTLAFDGAPISTSFDAGVQFSSIESIVVRIMGEGEEGELRLTTYSGGGFMLGDDPPPPTITEKPFSPPLSARFLDDEGKGAGNYALSVDGAEDTWQADFGGPYFELIRDMYFSHLLDGTGVIELASENSFITLPWTRLDILEPSALHVTGAQIILTGTLAAVPTPGSGTHLLAGIGLYVVRQFRRQA